MNRTQLYTLGGALLASTALSGAAGAATTGRFPSVANFATTGVSTAISTATVSVANSVFSTTASTANAVTLNTGNRHFGASFNNNFISGTNFSVEFTIAGARFIQSVETLANTNLLVRAGSAGSSFVAELLGANCSAVTALVDLFVINYCSAGGLLGGTIGAAGGSANVSAVVGGIYFSGVLFNNASGLATVGSTVTLTSRVYNADVPSQIFEPSSTTSIITSANAMSVTVTSGTNAIASATTTPLAFTALSTSNDAGTLTQVLVNVSLTGSGAFAADLTTTVTPATATSSARITVTSSIFSSSAVSSVQLRNGTPAVASTQTTAANFSGGAVTFDVSNTIATSFAVAITFNNTAQIPAASAGTVSVSFGTDSTLAAATQAIATATGASASFSRGGFRSEVNTFFSSAVTGFQSFLRIHNNGGAAGAVTVTVVNDNATSGAALGSSFTTASIQPGGTMQLTAAEIEGSAVTVNLPSGGAAIPTASRAGFYTVQVTGPIVGYVQHILFNPTTQQLADVSSFRNNGNTTAAP